MIATSRTYPPSFHLWREVHRKEWSVAEFARRTELGYHTAHSLLLGGRAIGEHEAIGLAQALGRGANYWLELQKEWEANNANR